MFEFIAVPFGYVLRAIYDFVGNYGLSIIIFTIFTKILMYPLQLKSKKSMRQLQKLQPKMQQLQKTYANNKQKYQEEVAKLYQTEKVNPAGSCLPMLITLPIMLGLYYVVQQPLTYLLNLSPETITKMAEILSVDISQGIQRSEIVIAQAMNDNLAAVSALSENITSIDFNFLGFNLAGIPSFWPISAITILTLLPIISGLSSFAVMIFTQKLQGTSMDGQPGSMKIMMYMMPLMSVYIGSILPAGVTLYWITGNIATLFQELVMYAQLKKMDEKEQARVDEENARRENNRKRELELKKEEQKRIAEEKNRIAKENAEKGKKG